MSRYSRNFDNKSVTPENIRRFPGYTRYREAVDGGAKVACHLCDGMGAYAGTDGIIDCDLCDGTGVMSTDELQEVALFRTRNKDGQ